MVSDEKLIEDLQELAEELGRTPRTRDMRDHGSHSAVTYQKRFGSWNDSLKEAGFEARSKEFSEEKLITELQEFADKLGHTPTKKEMREKGPHSGYTYWRHFDCWNNALKQANLKINKLSTEERTGEGERAYGKGYPKARRKVFSRDNYNCRTCGSRSNLHCHHIMPRREFENVSKSNTLDNLIVLCSSCHTKFEGRWREADPDTFVENAQDYLES